MRLSALAPRERALVELVSVFYEGVPRTDLARALGRIGDRERGRAPSGQEILPLLEGLARRGWLEGDLQWRVRPELVHLVTLELAEQGRLASTADAVRGLRPASEGDDPLPRWRWSTMVREARIELYEGRWDAARELVTAGMFAEICRPFDRSWVERLPPDLRGRALMDVLDDSVATLSPRGDALEMLEATAFAEPEQLTHGAHHLLVEQLLLRGRLAEARQIALARPSVNAQVGAAWLLALDGNWTEAITSYERALTAFVKQAGKRHPFFPDRGGLFFVVALLADGKTASLKRAKSLAAAAQKKNVSAHLDGYAILSEAADVLGGEGESEDTLYIASGFGLAELDPMTLLLSVAASVWVGTEVPADVLAALGKRALAADAAGYTWLAAQSADAVLAAGGKDEAGRLSALRARLVGVSLAHAVTRKERWSEALDALAEIAIPARSSRVSKAAAVEAVARIAWIVTVTKYRIDVAPREQSRAKTGWSKGRPIALERLAREASTMDFLTAPDRAVCSAIEEHVTSRYYGRYRDLSYALDPGAALRALIGAPNVLTEIDGALVPIEVRERKAKIKVERTGGRRGGFRVRLDPMPTSAEETTMLVSAGPTTIEVIELEEKHRAITKVLGKSGLDLPAGAEPRLREILALLSRFVPADADLDVSSDAPADAGELVVADATPTLLVRPLGDGLTLQTIVRPLGLRGPAVVPGVGGTTAFAEIGGQQVRARRDLAAERRCLAAAIAACPTIASAQTSEAGYTLRERDLALAALVELRSAGSSVHLEWPEGQPLEVTDTISVEALAVSVRATGDAFEIDGALEVPGGRPIALAPLLGYLDASPGRFLQLDQGRFLALSHDMRRRLDALRALGEPSRKRLRVHRLLVAELEDLLAGARIDSDAAWRDQRDRMTATQIEDEVPSTFRGELRPFQLEGFRWLARLGRWGAGACLADEMGLGKTVQALTLLLLRAPEGPSLVVAPTSVLSSWCEHAARFAPTLRIQVHAGEDRVSARSQLGPFDVVLTSYALLHADIDVLAPISFVVAVLDEAQAIKNPESQRAQAAARLTAEQRVVMTGTPVENRLEDLWSLFRFASPGLLGTRASFDARFARPIEQGHDDSMRDRLRRMVQPFLLRRTKTNVLDELPPRTEVTLRVSLAPREVTLYEAIRGEAIRGLDAHAAGASSRMHLLAAITRMRRAACSEQLVLPARARRSPKPAPREPSAKLEALGELLDEILPNGHKVLVFSQFVDHLALVKELLDARGTSYLYLDGSTPLGKRKTAIDAFQAGRADVFLISLKAGGFGLNLTAADYVVHMDPWWNPAVEDQASDRAHRIGQRRPVTIYRIVAKDTIEDRIVELHHRKRALADALLEGAEAPARMGEEELLELIRAR